MAPYRLLRCSGLVGSDVDALGPFVAEPGPGPIDDRLRSILTGGEEREVHRTPGQPGGATLHRVAALRLRDRRAATDGRHRALVVVAERLRRLAGDEPGDALRGMAPG